MKEDLVTEIYDQIHNLLDLSTRYGFDKNLWHNYLAFLLAMSENPFTLVSEKVGANEGTVNEFAKGDFAKITCTIPKGSVYYHISRTTVFAWHERKIW